MTQTRSISNLKDALVKWRKIGKGHYKRNEYSVRYEFGEFKIYRFINQNRDNISFIYEKHIYTENTLLRAIRLVNAVTIPA